MDRVKGTPAVAGCADAVSASEAGAGSTVRGCLDGAGRDVGRVCRLKGSLQRCRASWGHGAEGGRPCEGAGERPRRQGGGGVELLGRKGCSVRHRWRASPGEDRGGFGDAQCSSSGFADAAIVHGGDDGVCSGRGWG